MKRSLILLALLLGAAGTLAAEPERPLPTLVLPATSEAMSVRVELPSTLVPQRGMSFQLREVGDLTVPLRGGFPVPGADGTAASGRLGFVAAVPPAPPGASGDRRFRLEPLDVGASEPPPGPVAAAPALESPPSPAPGPGLPRSPSLNSELQFRFREVDENSLALDHGSRPVFVYRHGIISKAGVPAHRARSSYLHPLYGLDGEELTDDFPVDHYHHRGVFWSWPHVGVDGRQADLWMLQGITNRFERWLAREEGAGGAVLGVENGWYVATSKVMTERIWLTVHPEQDDQQAIDLDCTWIPMGRPVTLAGAEGKSYGGMTIRYAPGSDTVITTPLGNGTNDLYMTKLPWADLSRRFEGRNTTSGAALFVAPDHPSYPPTWLTRHYGVLCLGWPGVEAQTFAPDVPIRCRYRLWVHRGTPTPAALERAYRAYVDGTKARWEVGTDPQPLRASLEADRVRVFVGDSLFTEYCFPADGKLPHFFPLNGPRSGQSVTIRNADPYPHHASLWLGCDQVNGGNYWQEGLDRGQIRSKDVRLIEAEGERVAFEQDCIWERPGAEAPFDDHRRIRIFAPSPERRVIDVEVTLKARIDVTIGKSNHSLFAARMAPDLAAAGGGALRNPAGGLAELGTFGRLGAWMDARGKRPTGTEGLTLFPHPANDGGQARWFTRDYGFLSPTPMYWLEGDALHLRRGDSLRLRYRVLIHADAPPTGELDRVAKAWAAE